MDPEETYRKLNRAIRDGDREEAFEALEALLGWLSSRGGFMPRAYLCVGLYEKPTSSAERVANP